MPECTNIFFLLLKILTSLRGDGDFEYRYLRMMMRIGFLRVCGCSGENTCSYEFFARVLPGSGSLTMDTKDNVAKPSRAEKESGYYCEDARQ
jgi:hypothetical protein